MTQKGAAGEEDGWKQVYDELNIPVRKNNTGDSGRKLSKKNGRSKNSFSAKWFNTKYGKRLKIQVKDTALWLSESEARKLVFVILEELL
ncbi:MAG: hypothetical protein DRN04_16695 [Thermoprotei archaeon]|nr:MAG: hypothetical protein DRN04_16695 [Thermoprotei archaeon]